MISTEFLQSILNGDEDSIQALIRAHQRPVFQLALSILDTSASSPAEAAAQAEIATRETFIQAIDRLGRYREETPFTAWLYGIAINVSRRRYRLWQAEKRLRKLFAPFQSRVENHAGPVYAAAQAVGEAQPGDRPAPAAATSVEGTGAGLSSDEALWNAVRGLDERLRLPVVLRYYHDFPVADIARMLKIREGAVHARLDQAREKLAKT